MARVRPSIQELEKQYTAGNTEPLTDVIRAWRGIQLLPPTDDNSFFKLAGYHGEPFRGAGWGNPQWWGGYCHHGNVLFPTWHRAYVHRLEKALQSIPGCENVMQPFWDETNQETATFGVPAIFLTRTFQLDGATIPNPLYSYTFQAGVYDNLSPFPDTDYTKPPGYQTVRYPFSGLVGPAELPSTQAHNKIWNDKGDVAINQALNDNVKNWLDFSFENNWMTTIYTGTRKKFAKCLEAPNYTVFSNTTSSTQWNEDHFGVKKWAEEGSPSPAEEAMVALESPHNDIHLSIGGFDVKGAGNFSHELNANGDMGENDTAGFDPIFFFHHCFIDKVFWDWQKKWSQTTSLEIIPEYPGTNSVDNQGPTPGVAGNTWLTMDTPLAPFKTTDGSRFMISRDVFNVETQLGYTYPIVLRAPLVEPVPKVPPPALRISGVNRAKIAGSMILTTWVSDPNAKDKPERCVGYEAVLSRWHVTGCANCQTHLGVKTFMPLHGFTPEEAEKLKFDVKLHTRADPKGKTLLGGEKGFQGSIQLGRTHK